jgi:transposase-like protein
MARMVPGIETVAQHQEQLRGNPDSYRPERCPHCGKGGLHHHGHYERNTPRGEGMAYSLGSLFIPRFYCPKCRRTCSRLPACLSPRRQYWWKSQQAVLERLISGESFHEVARRLWPSRRTIGRWWRWLREGFDAHSLHLRSRFPELGRMVDWKAFWVRCFDQMSLGEAMGWLDRMEVRVP